MEKENIIVDLYRKVICSLTCIEKQTSNDEIKNKSLIYINQFIDRYEQYLNKKECLIYNVSDVIDFCNDCYIEVEVFDYAEDVEYGVIELIKEINNEKGETMEKEYNNDGKPTYANISESFVKIIGYISIILNLDSYAESSNEYKYILSKITDWASKYEISRDLSSISQIEMQEIYERVNDLQTKYICNDKIGSESELSDYTLNWMWHLMVLKKNFTLDKKEYNGN